MRLLSLILSVLLITFVSGGVSAARIDYKYKVDAALLNKLETADGNVDIIVLLKGYRDYVGKVRADRPSVMAVQQASIRDRQENVIKQIKPSRIKLKHRFSNILGFSATVSAEGLEELTASPEVEFIEEDQIVNADLAQGIPLINASLIRSSYDGSGVSIAVVDTGIDYRHPMLGDGGFPNAKVIGGYDFGDQDSDPKDCNGHGTSVAGIVAGTLAAGPGDYMGGVAHNAKLYGLKIVAGCSNIAYNSEIVAAWDWAITHKNDDPNNPILIINTSFSGGKYTSACDNSQQALAAAADNAAANGITVFSSSGNDGYTDGISSPACVANSISVGAVYDADVGYHGYSNCNDATSSADQVTCFSNSADFLDILAPSNDAFTTASGGGFTSSFGGTSAASPYAAGVAALVQNYSKTLNGFFYSPYTLKAKLLHGDLIADPRNSIVKPRVNVESALNFKVLKTNIPPVVDGDMSEYEAADVISFSSSSENRVIVRALWNDEALYLAYEVSDSELNAFETGRDGSVWNDDSVEWGVDTLNNGGGAADPDVYMLPDDYHGIVNILNTHYDERGTDTPGGDADPLWDGTWESAVQVIGSVNNNSDTDDGYTVEVKIPWTDFEGFSPVGNETVRLGFLQNDADSGGYSNGRWPYAEGAFANASKWQEVLLSANSVDNYYYYCDKDSDTYVSSSIDGSCLGIGCEPAGCYVDQGDDCDDNDSSINPGATEVCDEIDNDCNGFVDAFPYNYLSFGVCYGEIYVEVNDQCGGKTPCYDSIQEGVIAAADGSIIKVAQGTYSGNISPHHGQPALLQGGWNSDFSSRSHDPDLTTIEGKISIYYSDMGGDQAIDVIDGFTIKYGGVRYGCFDIVRQYGPELNLKNTIITDSTLLTGSGRAIDMYASWCGVRLDLVNTIIYGNNLGIDIHSGSSSFSGAAGIVSVNNTISDNNTGILTSEYADGYDFHGSSYVISTNDIIWGNNVDIDISQGGSVSASHSDIGIGPFEGDGTNISLDPQFEDGINGDYHLSPDSPLINRGDNSEILAESFDFEGDPRILYATVDIGADEFSTLRIFKASVSPVVDGDLSEYSSIDSVSLTLSGGNNTMTVKALYDDAALYLAYEVSDSELNASVTERDGAVWSDDSVEWSIDTLNDNGGSGDPDSPYMLSDDYHGIINILNTQYDSQGTATGTPSGSWDGNWESVVQINGTNNDNSDTDTGYAVEVEIPWTSIGYAGTPSEDITVRVGFLLNDKDGSYYGNVKWPEGGGTAFENSANWEEVLLMTNYLPSANAGGPYYANEGQTVILDGSGSVDIDSSIVLYEWDVDNDGSFDYKASSPFQNHTYAQEGEYAIRLRVVDSSGAVSNAYSLATIADSVPSPDFTAFSSEGGIPLTVTFTNWSSGYDKPLSYEWDFDNDGTVDSTDLHPTYTYTTSGVYDVRLVVTDADGSVVTEIKEELITVKESLYVDMNGTCWGNSPCYSTIQSAIDGASENTLIKVPRGTHYENIVVDDPVAGLKIQGGWSSDFQSRSKDPSLTIVSGDINGDGTGDGSVFSIIAEGITTDVTIEGLKITEGSESGIMAMAINAATLYLTVEHNILTDNKALSGGGISVASVSGSSAIALVINNLITDNVVTLYGGGVYALSDNGSAQIDITNNTIVDNQAADGGGLTVHSQDGGGAVSDILNTIVWGNTDSGIGYDIYLIEDDSGGDSLSVVNLSHSDAGEVSGNGGTINDNGTNYDTDPLFVDMFNGDYRLSQMSVLIDTGTNSGAPSDDFEGDIRPANGKGHIGLFTDIGADEFESKWSYVSAGYAHSMALKTDGTLWGWGFAHNGELGDGLTESCRSNPGQVGNDSDWEQVRASSEYTLAMKSDKSLWGWGKGIILPELILADSGFVLITPDIALKSDGTLWESSGWLPTYSQVGTDDDWIHIASGGHDMAIKSDGSLWGKGSNNFGQLGDGTLNSKSIFVRIGTDDDWASVEPGVEHTLALKQDGTLWAWGHNYAGQLGDGSTTNKSYPVQVGADNDWIFVDAGEGYSLAIKSDGTLWAWGSNSGGQLGDGTTTYRYTPVQVGSDSDWLMVSAGWSFVLGLKTDGSTWGWGYNFCGCAGGGDNTTPTQIMQQPNSLPVGVFTAVEGQTITLDGSGSEDHDGTIVLYEWDVENDGVYDYSLSSSKLDHVYAQQGLYSIKLKVTDNLGATGEGTTTANITDTAPTADFTGAPTDGSVVLTVDFDNLSEGYDQPLSYEWDFDSDGTVDNTDESPEYPYSEMGLYSVTLNVIDSDGSQNALTRSNYINICGSPVRIQDVSGIYESLQQAYNDAFSGATIQVRNLAFSENPVFDLNKDVSVDGGYNCNYSAHTGFSTISGDMTIIDGKLTVESGVLKIQ